MRLIQLEYFIKAAQLENITLAANELFISQPALSKQISQLEDELGAPLFIKDGRRIKLSPYGKRFLPYVEESLNQLKSGISEVEQMKFHLQNSIAIHLSVCSMWIPEFIQSFHQHDPSLFFSISQHRQHEPAYDYLITSELNQEDNFIPLFEEPLMLAVPKNHPLATQESISIKDIKQQTVIGLTKHNALRQTLDSYMKQLNVKLDIAYECDDPATLRGLITSHIGITFVPVVSWHELVTDSIILKPLSEGSMTRTVYLCWHNTTKKKPFHDKIVMDVTRFFKEKEAHAHIKLPYTCQ